MEWIGAVFHGSAMLRTPIASLGPSGWSCRGRPHPQAEALILGSNGGDDQAAPYPLQSQLYLVRHNTCDYHKRKRMISSDPTVELCWLVSQL
jgi:hypothetical protein